MKKIISILLLVLMVLSLNSCNINGTVDPGHSSSSEEFDIADTKQIVLGNKVDSVVIKIGTDEEITFDNTADFYEVLANVGALLENGKKYSYVAETQLEDQNRFYSNANIYYFDNGALVESRIKKEGSDDVAVVDEYSFSKQVGDRMVMDSFARYIYKADKAFGGMVYGENGYESYYSDSFPLIPAQGSELGGMEVESKRSTNILFSTRFFIKNKPFEANGKTYDFDQFVTREYELYENYIVFKQTSPFLIMDIAPGQDPELIYARVENSNCSITQEAYYNVKTGEFELIKLYGNTLWSAYSYTGKSIQINMQIYIHDIKQSEFEQKTDYLFDYVTSNVN